MSLPSGSRPLAPSLVEHLRRTARIVGRSPEEVTPPCSRTVLVAGVRYHLLDWETPAPPVLLLHGYGLNAHTWDATALALSQGYRCIVPDQRGHGLSEWGSRIDYTTEARSRAALEIADALGLDTFAVAGHSMGGLAALGLAARAPGRVTGLAVIEASPFGVPTTSIGSRLRERTFASVDDAFELVRRAAPKRDPELLRQNLLLNLRERADGRWAWRYDPSESMLRPEDRTARNRGLIGQLARVTAPSLIVRGRDSETLTSDSARALASALPRADVVEIEDAGHNVQGDAPRQLAEALLRFFDGVHRP